jgi:hypothetical protein
MRLMLNIDAVRLDGGTQGRVTIDQPTIYHYLDRMKEGDIFPPIEVVHDGENHWLVDGFHRWHALKLLNLREIEVDYEKGTKLDAIRRSLFANNNHGLPLTIEDRKKKVRIALELPESDLASDREIARMCHVSHPFVASIRRPKVKEQNKTKRGNISTKEDIVDAEIINTGGSITTSGSITTGESTGGNISSDGVVPDASEEAALDLALQKDRDVMNALLDADDKLAEAHKIIKELNEVNARLELRIKALMAEKAEAIGLVKKLQKQLDKVKK